MTTTRKPGQRRTAVEKITGAKARLDRQKATGAKSDGPRLCAARPNGPYGIDAKAPCRKPTRRPSAALCEAHEKVWRVEARRRAQERGSGMNAMRPKVVKLPTTLAGPVAEPSAIAAFATPELAAKARAKRPPRKPSQP